MCEKFQGQKDHTKKNIQNLPTCVPMKKISLLSTLNPSQGFKVWVFAMKFFSRDHHYIDNMYAKFQVQKIYTKKYI